MGSDISFPKQLTYLPAITGLAQGLIRVFNSADTLELQRKVGVSATREKQIIFQTHDSHPQSLPRR